MQTFTSYVNLKETKYHAMGLETPEFEVYLKTKYETPDLKTKREEYLETMKSYNHSPLDYSVWLARQLKLNFNKLRQEYLDSKLMPLVKVEPQSSYAPFPPATQDLAKSDLPVSLWAYRGRTV